MQSKETVEKPPAEGTASHDFVPPQALVEFMADGWIDRPAGRGRHPESERFAARRQALSRAYAGTYVVVPAGVERVRANDTFFRFRPSSDIAYLLGGGEPGALLVLEPHGAGHRSVLFVPAHNRGSAEFFTDRVYGELWVGRHRGVDESREYYGVDECRPLQSLRAYLEELRAAALPVRVLRGHDDHVDALFERAGGDDELTQHLSETRLIKDEYELAELRKACAITKRAFEDAIATMRDGTSERDVEAVFWRRARNEANDVGYLTIAAGG
jgi:Xaa-Pro aminopeptidase